jgi:Ca-activated chloride channel family protein
MEVGGRRLEGLLAERRRARRVYDEIVRGRRDPALVEQVGRSRFRLSVFPVLPGEETVVELSWIQPVPLSQGAYRYVYPLAGGGGQAVPRELVLGVRVRAAAPITAVTASSDDVEVVRLGPNEVTASLERSGAGPGRDLVVTAAVTPEAPGLSLKTYREQGHDGWFLAVVTPPPGREEAA